MPERDYNYGATPPTIGDGHPDFGFEPKILKVITMDDWSDKYFQPVGMALAYSLELVKLAEQEGTRLYPGERWLLAHPEIRTSTNELLRQIHALKEGIVITGSLFVLRELDLLGRLNIIYYNLSNGRWRVSMDINKVGSIDILDRDVEQSQRYLDTAAKLRRQSLSSLALADRTLTDTRTGWVRRGDH